MPTDNAATLLVPFYTGTDAHYRLAGTVKVPLPAGVAAGSPVRITARVEEDKTLRWWFRIDDGEAQPAPSVDDPWTSRALSANERALMESRRAIRDAMTGGRPVTARMLVDEANAIRLTGDLDAALLAIEDCIDESERDATAHNIRGDHPQRAGAGAPMPFTPTRARCSSIPTTPSTSPTPGIAFQQDGGDGYRTSIASLRMALDKDPTLAYAYIGLGIAYRGIGDEARAQVEYRRALEHPAQGDRGPAVRPGRLEVDVDRAPRPGRLSARGRGAQRAEAHRPRRALRRRQQPRDRGAGAAAGRRGGGMKKKKKKAKKARGKTPTGRAIARAREGVTRAGQKLTDRLAELERVADGIDAAAVERFQSEAVRELAEDQLLRDLADLQAVFASKATAACPPTSSPSAICPRPSSAGCRPLFGLTPYLEAGKAMQVPSDKLDNFALTRDLGDAPSGVLVRLRVLAPGWKRGGEVVVPPRAELIAD